MCFRRYSDRLGPALTGADPNAVVQRQYEDLPVSDLAAFSGASALDNGVDCRLNEVLIDGDLKLHFSHQINGDFSSPVNLRLPFLPTEALDIENGQPNHLDFVKGRLDFLQLAWLDDRDDEFHSLEQLYEGWAQAETGPRKTKPGSEAPESI